MSIRHRDLYKTWSRPEARDQAVSGRDLVPTRLGRQELSLRAEWASSWPQTYAGTEPECGPSSSKKGSHQSSLFRRDPSSDPQTNEPRTGTRSFPRFLFLLSVFCEGRNTKEDEADRSTGLIARPIPSLFSVANDQDRLARADEAVNQSH